MSRLIVLDTETTGLEVSANHRIIEIGCVEVIDRRLTGNNFHQYLQPDREIDAGAMAVHGISAEFLQDKPRFKDIVQRFMAYIKDAELVIHNAVFDVGFINHELRLLKADWAVLESYCRITDTLKMARERHPGQKNNLDALCKRYDIDNSQRKLHGALLDAEILADVYLAMTGGQVSLLLGGTEEHVSRAEIRRIDRQRPRLPVLHPSTEEMEAHQQRLQHIDKISGGHCLWLQKNSTENE